MNPDSTPSPALTATPRLVLTVITSIFFMFGFLTCLNDILIPHLKAVFELNYAQSMLIQFTFFGAYFLTSLPGGKLVEHVGHKEGIIAGLCITGIGAIGFYPAAELRLYGVFLGSLFVLASGIALLQVAANPYVARLGPEHTSSIRMTLAHGCNSLGTAIAPLFGGWLILSGTVKNSAEIAAMPEAAQLAYRMQEAQLVQIPYLGLGLALFVLALGLWLFRLPILAGNTGRAAGARASLRQVLQHRHVVLGVFGIFFYVGAEVAIGSLMVNYFALPEIAGFSEEHASRYLTGYWTLAMLGRFIGSGLMLRISPRKLLVAFAGINMLLLATSMAGHGLVSVYSLMAIGLFNSIMFPTIYALSVHKLGALTDKAAILLNMAIVGGAIVPLLQGLLADRIGLQPSFMLPLLCYGYIGLYALSGAVAVRKAVSST